jgi:hypothetical protein
VTTATTATTTEPITLTESKLDKNGNTTYKKYAYSDGKTAKEEFFGYDKENNFVLKEQTEYFYNSAGNPLRISSYDIENGTPKLNSETKFMYNENGILSTEEFYALSPKGALFLRDKTEYFYDESGKLINTVYRVYGEDGKEIP